MRGLINRLINVFTGKRHCKMCMYHNRCWEEDFSKSWKDNYANRCMHWGVRRRNHE